MITLGGKRFDVIALDDRTYPQWMEYVIGLAKDMDHPVARFVEKHLDGVDPSLHQSILDAWMKRPDWDEPSEELIHKAASSRQATAHLAMLCLVPSSSWPDAWALVTDENKKQIQDAVNSVANPTDEDIKNANNALRERLKARAEEAGTEAG